MLTSPDADRRRNTVPALLRTAPGTSWDPPGFFHVETGDRSVQGALQKRRELVPGTPMLGLEGTFGVDDIASVVRAAVAGGGRLLTAPATISGVGHLAWIADPDGNVVGAMEYDSAAG